MISISKLLKKKLTGIYPHFQIFSKFLSEYNMVFISRLKKKNITTHPPIVWESLLFPSISLGHSIDPSICSSDLNQLSPVIRSCGMMSKIDKVPK